ncbi:MAG: hypothetical protein IPG99_14745 [Ignavibacteria bacterium]|nr:hypothetical protein [Ignavibacteria bacterium]
MISIFASNFSMRIIKLIAVFLIILIASSASAQSPRWSTIEYVSSSGPVSPEYQYNYSIVINEDGSSKLISTNQEGTKEYDFNIPNNKKGMKKLKKELKKSCVLELSPDELKSDKTLIGGKTNKLVITLWQDPMLDQPPQKIEIPSNVKEEYESQIDRLYTTIMNLVPASVKTEAGIY